MNLAPTQDISIKKELTEEEMDISQDADQSQSLIEPHDMNTSQSEPALHSTSSKLPLKDDSSEDPVHSSREKENNENSLTASHPGTQKKRPRRAANKYELISHFCFICGYGLYFLPVLYALHGKLNMEM